MLQDISFYFELGWRHILSMDATDHLLFLLTLTCIYLKEKKICCFNFNYSIYTWPYHYINLVDFRPNKN